MKAHWFKLTAAVVLASVAIAAGCSSGPTQEEVEARLAQVNGWSDMKFEEVDDGHFRGTAVSRRGELINVEVSADEQSIETRWENANGRGHGSSGTTTKSPPRLARRDPNAWLQFWLLAMVIVLVAAARVAYAMRRAPKPGDQRKPSWLLDYDYPLRGWRGVLVALFYIGLLAALTGAAIWASKADNPNWPEKPAPAPRISGPL